MNRSRDEPGHQSHHFLIGGGEMGERTRSFDWSRTDLGSMGKWPQSLKTLVRTLLNSQNAMWLGWGPDFTFFSNDAFARLTLGPKQPWALGRSAREVLPEIWSEIGPRAESVRRTGQAICDEGLLLILERQDFPEETYHTFSYSPIHDDDGSVGGILCVVTDDTERKLAERRLQTLRDLALSKTDVAQSVEEASRSVIRILASRTHDLPFILIYLLNKDSGVARRVGCHGLAPDTPGCPAEVDLDQSPWPLRQVAHSGDAVVVDDLEERFGPLFCGVWPEPTRKAVVLPLAKSGQKRPAGFVVAGVSPRLVLDDGYMGFLVLLSGHIATVITNAQVYDEEQQRVELDRAKTTFFSNASDDNRPRVLVAGDNADMRNTLDLLESLRKSEERFRILFETMSEGFAIDEIIFDETGRGCDLRYLEVNPAFERHTGLKRSDILGRTVLELFPNSEPLWFQRYGEVVTSGVPVHFQARFGPLERWFEVSAYKTGPKQFATVFFDVTDRIQVQEALRESEERFRSLFDSMDEAFCVIEMFYDANDRASDYRFLVANQAFERHTGLKDVVGRTIRTLVPNQEAHWFEIYGKVAATGEPIRFVDKAKSLGRWYDVSAYRVGGPDSRKVGIIFTDVTARKRDEEKNLELLRELETQNAFVKAVISQVPAAIVVADAATGQIRLTNEEAHRIVKHKYHPGKRLEDYGNTYIREAFASDGSRYASGRWPLDRALRGETVVEEEIENVMFDDSRVIVRVNAAPIRVDDKIVAAVVAFHDVTDRKLAERSTRFLADASAALSGLVDYMDTLQRVAQLAVTGFADWAIVDIAEKPGAARRLFVAHADPAKANLATAMHNRFALAAGSGPANILRTGRGEIQSTITDEMLRIAALDESDLRFLRELGPRSYIGVPLKVQGETVGVLTFLLARPGGRFGEHDLAVANDLASRASIAIENSQLYARLKDADRRKDEFLATLAHELRNPLAPIRNGLQLLRLSGSDTVAGEKARTMMERQLSQMVRLVDDLMDVSRINQGKLELRKERIELAAVLASAIETSRPLIEAMNHDLQVVLPPRTVLVEADLTRLAQVFSNLLNNASKYSERGGRIALTYSRQGSEVSVSVRDSGIGIAADQLPRIFEMFSQVNTALERSQGGLGIGLSLVKQLLEMHGGRIEARSAGPGKGSEFIVRLPFNEALGPQSRIEQDRGAMKTSLRILVVDDNRDSADSLADMLTLMGGCTRTAYDGEEAVAATTDFQPDVILLDIGLPKLNGYEACRRIRALQGNNRVVLIAQTGWGQDEDRRRTQAAGFDHHLVKPVDPAVLMKLLEGLPAEAKR